MCLHLIITCSSFISSLKWEHVLYNRAKPSVRVEVHPAETFSGQWSLHSLTAPILALPHQLAVHCRGQGGYSKPFTTAHTQRPVSPQLQLSVAQHWAYLRKMLWPLCPYSAAAEIQTCQTLDHPSCTHAEFSHSAGLVQQLTCHSSHMTYLLKEIDVTLSPQLPVVTWQLICWRHSTHPSHLSFLLNPSPCSLSNSLLSFHSLLLPQTFLSCKIILGTWIDIFVPFVVLPLLTQALPLAVVSCAIALIMLLSKCLK